MRNHQPLVSIGLAVFNGEKYLEQAIDSILSQTFTDFELVICDNDSTDRTKSICQNYADRDNRIRYYRNPTNIGGVNNENRTFELSTGKYFRLMAHDDLLAPKSIEKSVAILEKNPEIILCYSDIVIINGEGQEIDLIDSKIGTESQPWQRFRRLASKEHRCEATYALTRADILAKVDPQLNYSDSDRTFLSDLGLYGKFYQIHEPLFYKRYHQGRSIEVYSDRYKRMAWFDPNIDENKLPYSCYFMYWRQVFHFISIVARAPIDLNNKILCYSHIFTWSIKNKKKLITELFILIDKNPIFNRKYSHTKQEPSL